MKVVFFGFFFVCLFLRLIQDNSHGNINKVNKYRTGS